VHLAADKAPSSSGSQTYTTFQIVATQERSATLAQGMAGPTRRPDIRRDRPPSPTPTPIPPPTSRCARTLTRGCGVGPTAASATECHRRNQTGMVVRYLDRGPRRRGRDTGADQTRAHRGTSCRGTGRRHCRVMVCRDAACSVSCEDLRGKILLSWQIVIGAHILRFF